MNNIEKIHCGCGNTPVKVETSPYEEKHYGCSRKGCCVEAYECPGCQAHWTFKLEAPDLFRED